MPRRNMPRKTRKQRHTAAVLKAKRIAALQKQRSKRANKHQNKARERRKNEGGRFTGHTEGPAK